MLTTGIKATNWDFLVRGYIIMVVKYKGQKLRYVKDFHGKEVLWILSPEQIEMRE